MSKPEAGHCKAEYERLAEAVRFAIDYAGGRESEWGERAKACFRILETAVNRKPIQQSTQSSDEDPDKWVVQDRVPVRVGVDEIHWSDWHADRWEVAFGHWYQETRHGSTFDGAVVSVRCRRRDLPPVEQPEEPWKWRSEENRKQLTEAAAMALLKPKQCAVGCHGPRCPNDALPGKDHCAECAKDDAPAKTRIRLWSTPEGQPYFAPIPANKRDVAVLHDAAGFYVFAD